ncbi:CYTH domain-containing protein [Nevskia soli]|uniref:CYTH domain-containing protein n=1 Tax=Nevskia soli TaxID=418856 RepID=UPI0004A70800|nr:CYTH domain-containing protein [Nevskia soli]
MPTEIERKFLVVGDSWRAESARSTPMRQGYLVELGGPASVRVRLEGKVGKLNIKAAVVGAARAEYEYEIPAAEAEEMLATLCSGLVLKTRHYVERDGLTWEIDVFEGANAGLVVAEVELDAVDQEFPHPAWLGRELTDEQRYYNHALAKRPYGEWSQAERE